MNYDIFVIDPPWDRKKGGKRSVRPIQGRSLDYKTIPTDGIFDILDGKVLPSPKHDRPHCVFMWTIDKFLIESEIRMTSRGYKLHARMVWDKGNGIAPAFTVRYSHEYLLWFYRPKLLPVDKSVRGKFTTVIRAPGREHSRKPDEAYAMIESLYPVAQRIDVFSREKRNGWDQFGDELNKFKTDDGCEPF